MKRNTIVLAITAIVCLVAINAQNSRKSETKENIIVDDTDIIFEGFKAKFRKSYANDQ